MFLTEKVRRLNPKKGIERSDNLSEWNERVTPRSTPLNTPTGIWKRKLICQKLGEVGRRFPKQIKSVE